jgi:sugar phosphate isomerase/epimerase
MTPSLSVRIAEHPRNKECIAIGFPALADLAREGGFNAMSLRASVVGVDSLAVHRSAVRAVLDEHELRVSMVTGDLPLATNDANATAALRDITPYLDLAEAMGTDLLRVMVHSAQDIPHLRRAADEAAERGMRLSQQCHWGSLAEVVDQGLELMRMTDRRNCALRRNLRCASRPAAVDLLASSSCR